MFSSPLRALRGPKPYAVRKPAHSLRPVQLSLFDPRNEAGATPVSSSGSADATLARRNPAAVTLLAPLPPLRDNLEGSSTGVGGDRETLEDGAVVDVRGQPGEGSAGEGSPSSHSGSGSERIVASKPTFGGDYSSTRMASAGRRLLDFRPSPALGRAATCTWAVGIGAWGESAVRTRLLGWGYEVLEAPAGASYDLVVHVPAVALRVVIASESRADCVPGGREGRTAQPRPRFARVQCKATLGGPEAPRRFVVRQGYRNTGQGSRPYDHDAFDLVACVCLQEDVVLFSPAGPERLVFGTEFIAIMRPYEREAFEAALVEVGALDPEERDLLAEPRWG